jgi:hypothetical protein
MIVLAISGPMAQGFALAERPQLASELAMSSPLTPGTDALSFENSATLSGRRLASGDYTMTFYSSAADCTVPAQKFPGTWNMCSTSLASS